jgi:hypothetical protein
MNYIKKIGFSQKHRPDLNPEIDTSMINSINNEHDKILKKLKS